MVKDEQVAIETMKLATKIVNDQTIGDKDTARCRIA